MRKSEILNNLETLSSEELARAVRDNVVDIKEIENEGVVPNKQLREILNLIENAETVDWEKACAANTVETYQNYLNVYQQGKYRDDARKKIEEVKHKELHAEEEKDWQEALKIGTIESLKQYRSKYPNAIHREEAIKMIDAIHRKELYAEDAIDQLRADINRIYANKKIMNPLGAVTNAITDHAKLHGNNKAILDLIGQDKNIVAAEVISQLLNQGILSRVDLQDIGIDRDFVKYLDSFGPEKLEYQNSEHPTNITGVLTEVYFWGIPSSGKTCAIGAVLSAAKNEVAENLEMHTDSKAYGFMHTLAEKFAPNASQVCTLPSGTPVGTIHEMKFTLRDKKKLLHPIALLDLAGELFTCMFQVNARKELSYEQETTLNQVTSLLANSQNRKMHFFVIEYGAEDKLYGDYTQRVYLEAATGYIKAHQVFDKSTDGVYILITKTDKISKDIADKKTHLQTYIKNYFSAFHNNLKSICDDFEINNGRVEIIPFTMGEVCFQNFCRFDSASARDVSNLILNRSVSHKPKGLWSKFTDLLTE